MFVCNILGGTSRALSESLPFGLYPTTVVLCQPLWESVFCHNQSRWLGEAEGFDVEAGGSRLKKGALKGSFSAFQEFPGRIFIDRQEWRARGRRPPRPPRTPVQGGPTEAATVLVKVEGRTAPSSVTSAWTQPRMPSSACVATCSGQFPATAPAGTLLC